ncbi:MAG: hypothetical protein ACJ79S_14665 [Gemmatimonadaceae bacterium]
MADRHKPHNGRAVNGQHHTRIEDFEDKRDDPEGVDLVRDDVRTGGAVADSGPDAGFRGERIQDLVDENREIVDKMGELNRGL